MSENKSPVKDTATAVDDDDDADDERRMHPQQQQQQEEEEKYRFLFLSHKDTDILTLAWARHMLPADFPPIETARLSDIKTEEDMVDLVNRKVRTSRRSATAIVVRLLGRGVPGFSYLVDYCARQQQCQQERRRQAQCSLIVVSGVPGSLEPDLTAMCTNVPSAEIVHDVTRYFDAADGCAHNAANMFRYLADRLWKFGFGYQAPMPQPDHGLYHPRFFAGAAASSATNDNKAAAEATAAHLRQCNAPAAARDDGKRHGSGKPTVAVVFYRCHFLSGNTAFVDALIDELESLDVNAVGLFTTSLRESQPHDNVNGKAVTRFPTALIHLLDEATGECLVDVVVSTMAFALGEVNPDGPTLGTWSTAAVHALNVPVLQAITSVDSRARWETSARGLCPLDTAMNVAIPEFDGRIITLPISFKAPHDETNDVHYYEPLADRVAQVAKQSARWGRLRNKANADKRVVFVLTNSSGKAQRIGDAVGLDSPASLMAVLAAMRSAGYDVGHPDDLPPDGDRLVQDLVDRCSYDEIYLTEEQLANAAGRVPAADYEKMFHERLPSKQKERMVKQWGAPPGEAYVHKDSIALAGLRYGNVFIALQPPRGYGMDPDKIYHTPDLPPPHNYYALYRWLAADAEKDGGWGADAMIHMGKHGTLEWLPGKGVGLSGECYPDTFLDDVPLIYPFILNDPGEGTQAKRRTHAVIIDHMTPPMTTADGYGELAQLMQLVDEYYQVEMLDPTKLPAIQGQIWDLIQQINLGEDLAFLLDHDHDGCGDDRDHHSHDHRDGIKRQKEGGSNRDGNHEHDDHHHGKEANHDHDHDHRGKGEDHDHDHGHRAEDDHANEHDHAHDHEHAQDHDHAAHEHDHAHEHEHVSDPGDDADHTHDHGHGSDEALTGDPPSAIAKMEGKDVAHLIETMDGYLCELAGAQIRDGLHILGQVPEGESMVDTLQALTRLPNIDVPSLREAIAAMFGLDSSALLANQGARASDLPVSLIELAGRPLASAGDAVQTIDELAKHLLALLAERNFDIRAIPRAMSQTFPSGPNEQPELVVSDVAAVLRFVCETLVPSLRGTTDEIKHLMDALNGEFVPAGPSGAPTRGMAHVLPTGRNFYSVNPCALPSMAAWDVGQGLAREVLARYRRETNGYPESVAISVWGTAAMRTHGDDVAEIFALLGVRPTWQRENHRVTGVELIPLVELGRPRIDVTVRISGFFRDAFPHLIALLDDAVNSAINADEPPEENYVRKHFLEDMAKEDGADETSARYRIFGCPPGAYGIGILDLIEAQNWKDDADFAETYINWGGYAYTSEDIEGVDARPQFTHRLTTVEVAIHNQDEREHDIFDSDDYFQFHGGMIATIRSLSGKSPKGYFGDTHNPSAPKVRDIKEESLRVYRSRVVNPKWIDSITRHGYKGASEMAATVDYLFGFDATADVVSDFMYEQVAQTYALDEAQRDFFERSNPWALRGIAERLLEAAQRGLWAEPNPETLQALRDTLLKTDAQLEGRSDQPA